MRSRLARLLGTARRRAAWIGGAALLIVLAAGVVAVGLDRAFLQGLLSTFLGAVLGFLVALYIDRHQRAEEAEDQRQRDAAAADLRRERDAAAADQRRSLDAEAEQRALDRAAAAAKSRRITVLTLLRDELGRIPKQMGDRQNRAYPPSDRLVDGMWQSLLSSGELRWIEDLELLRGLATAYDLVGVQAALEREWLAAVRPGTVPLIEAGRPFSNALVSRDRDAWQAVCAAYKAVDRALVADGEVAGPEPFCP